MARLKPYVNEIIITIIVFMWLLFTATNVNVTLGNTYLHFTWGSLALLIIGLTIFDKKLHITFAKRPGRTFEAILWGFAGWIILIITSVIVLRFIDPAQANVVSVIRLMHASTPALATSKIANLLTFGIAIAYIETQLWGRLLEFFSDVFRISLNKKNILVAGVIALIVALSLVFVFFHLTAKGITNNPALAIVFVMMAISLTMITMFEETRQAVYMHIIANTIASYLMLFALGFLQSL